MKAKNIYLDHAATTPLDSEVRTAMEPYLVDEFYNPSSLYSAARNIRKAVEDARHSVAVGLGARKNEIVFTAGGTESVNLAIQGTLLSSRAGSRDLSKDSSASVGMTNIVTTAIEHDAVLACAKQFDHKIISVGEDGIIDPAELQSAVGDETVMVSVMYANNEIGTIQPIAEIGKLVATVREDRKKRGIKLPIFFHTDATQAPNYLDLHVSRLGVDLMTLNGSKIYGPKQTGCLYVRTGVELDPLIRGGGQEHNLRSGTENVAGVIGFAKALEIAQSQRESESKRLSKMRDEFWTQIKNALPEAKLNGHPTRRLANNLNFSIAGIDGEQAVLYLDKEGIMVSTGSACSTGNTEPSHVLLATGCSKDEAGGSLRITFGRQTEQEELDTFIKVFPGIVGRLKQLRASTSLSQ